MRVGDEQVQALEWAYAALASDAPLAASLGLSVAQLADAVWADVAPTTTEGTVVVLSTSDAADTNALDQGPRLMSRVPLVVRVIGPGQAYDPLAAPARAVYDRLHGALNEPIGQGGMILTCTRTGSVAYGENAGGTQYRHLGHTFQVEIN